MAPRRTSGSTGKKTTSAAKRRRASTASSDGLEHVQIIINGKTVFDDNVDPTKFKIRFGIGAKANSAPYPPFPE
jgi:hypothetical protein